MRDDARGEAHGPRARRAPPRSGSATTGGDQATDRSLAGVRYADLVGATRARMELDDEKLHLGEMTLGEWRVSRIAARRFLATLEATARVVARR